MRVNRYCWDYDNEEIYMLSIPDRVNEHLKNSPYIMCCYPFVTNATFHTNSPVWESDSFELHELSYDGVPDATVSLVDKYDVRRDMIKFSEACLAISYGSWEDYDGHRGHCVDNTESSIPIEYDAAGIDLCGDIHHLNNRGNLSKIGILLCVKLSSVYTETDPFFKGGHLRRIDDRWECLVLDSECDDGSYTETWLCPIGNNLRQRVLQNLDAIMEIIEETITPV